MEGGRVAIGCGEEERTRREGGWREGIARRGKVWRGGGERGEGGWREGIARRREPVAILTISCSLKLLFFAFT